MQIKSITNQELKVALVYDRVNTPYGGAEQVLLALHQLFPDAPLYTSVYNDTTAPWAKQFDVIPSFLNKLKPWRSRHQWLLPLMPLAFESLDLEQYQLVISVTSAEAKGVITKPHQLHLCYLLTPPRYLYEFKEEYLQSRFIFRLPLSKQLTHKLLDYSTWWDQVAIHRPDAIIPLSRLTQFRVGHTYHVKTTQPIYPPVDMIELKTNPDLLKQFNLPKKYHLVVARLVTYKRIDLAIKVCAQLNHHLVIVGEGEQLKQLKILAKKLAAHTSAKIIFHPSQDQITTNTLMKNAQVFLSPGVDDFGLAPLQANLLGTPAVINQASGVAEMFKTYGFGTMIDGVTIAQFAEKIRQASLIQPNFAKIERIKQDLGQAAFRKQFKKVVAKHLKQQLNIKL